MRPEVHPDTKKIAIIDDHKIFLEGVKLLIGDMLAGAQILSFEQPQPILSALKGGDVFDLIICDLVMRPMNGIRVSAAIRERNRTVPILILSGITASDPTNQLIDIGVNGFVHKSLGHDVLAEAISVLLAGGSYFPSDAPDNETSDNSFCAVPKLSERHMDVLQLLAGGATNKEISAALQISENTVKTYMRQLFQELGANTRTACAHKAQFLGLI